MIHHRQLSNQQQQRSLLSQPRCFAQHLRDATTTNTRTTALWVSSSSVVNNPSSSSDEVVTTGISSPSSKQQQQLDTTSTTTQLSVEFPPPLTPLQRIQRAATFWSTALPIIISYYVLMCRIQIQQTLQSSSSGNVVPSNGSSTDILENNGKSQVTAHSSSVATTTTTTSTTPATLATNEIEDDYIEQLWKEQHATSAAKLSAAITNLKGFYVKTAQIISSRQDLFPVEYTEALSGFTDNLDPMPVELAKAVIVNELLHTNEVFEDVFVEFDPIPLGAASVAQVHRAVLTEKYGGRTVAVKIQRPSIESKLLGDIANLKAIARTFRDTPTLPLDYYTVFAELEQQLAQEFDFVAEAVAMDRIYNALSRAPDGSPREIPLVIPRPVSGLVSRRVLVMDYLDGIPLSRVRDEMIQKGINPDGPEAKLFGYKLMKALTTVFGRTILETGFFHADPHPGNIFVLKDGRIGLIDFGQVKQISGRNRETLCKVMIALDERMPGQPDDMDLVGRLSLELGVELNANAKPEAAAAIGIWLFDGSVTELPGGYDMGELSFNSPVRELKSFPQDLVLVGRSTILIKGLSSRLKIPWSLAQEWAPIARQVLNQNTNMGSVHNGSSSAVRNNNSNNTSRVRFRDVIMTLRQWTMGRTTQLAMRLPSPIRRRISQFLAWRQERKLQQQRNQNYATAAMGGE